MKKKYINSRYFKIPRLLELILHLVFFLIVLAFLHFLHIDDYVFDTNSSINNIFSLIFMSVAFIVYRILTSHTIVEEICINYEEKQVEFDYMLYFLLKKKLYIPFNMFSFYSNLDSIIRGGALSLRIFKENSMKIKLSHRYGWTRKQIYCINKDFLEITDGHVRKDTNWEAVYTLIKEKDIDC